MDDLDKRIIEAYDNVVNEKSVVNEKQDSRIKMVDEAFSDLDRAMDNMNGTISKLDLAIADVPEIGGMISRFKSRFKKNLQAKRKVHSEWMNLIANWDNISRHKDFRLE
jgi:hypothetical protein